MNPGNCVLSVHRVSKTKLLLLCYRLYISITSANYYWSVIALANALDFYYVNVSSSFFVFLPATSPRSDLRQTFHAHALRPRL